MNNLIYNKYGKFRLTTHLLGQMCVLMLASLQQQTVGRWMLSVFGCTLIIWLSGSVFLAMLSLMTKGASEDFSTKFFAIATWVQTFLFGFSLRLPVP